MEHRLYILGTKNAPQRSFGVFCSTRLNFRLKKVLTLNVSSFLSNSRIIFKNAKKVFLIACLLLIYTTQAQNLDVSVPNSVCLDERVYIQNNSTGIENFYWDFCVGDLQLVPNADTIFYSSSVLSAPLKGKWIKNGSNGNWFGFVSSRDGNTIYRYQFQNGLKSEFRENLLNGLVGVLDHPMGIEIISYNGNWFGYVLNQNSGELIRISFGSSLENDPVAVATFTGLSISSTRGAKSIEVVHDGNGFKALITSSANVVVLDLGVDPGTPPSLIGLIPITGALDLYGVSVIEANNVFYALLSDNNRRKIFHLNFGDTINTSHTQDEIVLGAFSFNSSPYDIEFVEEDGNYYAFFVESVLPLVRMDFGTDANNTSPSFSQVYTRSDANTQSFSIVKDSSYWVGLAVDWKFRQFDKYIFE